MNATCITILGSTGSIGRQTLSVAEHLGVSVAALTANENVERMAEQAKKFLPRLCVMGSEESAARLRQAHRAQSATSALQATNPPLSVQ